MKQPARRSPSRWAWALPTLLVGGLAFLGLREFDELRDADLAVRPVPLALAFGIYVAHVFGRGLIWHLMMRWAGAGQRAWQDITIWTTTVLVGHYIPGKIATYAGRVFAYRSSPISTLRLTFCFFLDVAGTMLGACLLVMVMSAFDDAGALTRYRLPALAAAALLMLATHPRPLGIALTLAARWTGREALPVAFDHLQTATVVALLAGIWFVLGAGISLLASAVTPLTAGHWPFVAAAFAISHVSGVLAVFAPGGLGVREGVFAALLSAIMPLQVASVVALAAGAWVVTAELAALALVLLMNRWLKRDAEDHGVTREVTIAPVDRTPR